MKKEDFRSYISELSEEISELLEHLQLVAPALGIDTRNKWWPKAPNALSRRLNEIAHALREASIEVEFEKSPDRNRVRIIKIRKISSESSESSEDKKQAQKEPKTADDITDDNNKASKISSKNKTRNPAQNGIADNMDGVDDNILIKNISEMGPQSDFYFSNRTGLWYCKTKDCKWRGDMPAMELHRCNQAKKGVVKK